MKKIKSISGSGISVMLFAASLVLIMAYGCKKSGWTDEIAEKRVLLNTVSITQGDSLPLLLGRDTTLTAVSGPDSATVTTLLWKSDNESIAKVDQNGKVTTVGLGSVNISVQSTDGGLRKAITRIDVIDKIIYATAINLSVNSLTTYPKVSTPIIATVVPSNVTYKKLNWSSANQSVATVNQNGVITGVAAGTTTITVQPADGGSARGTVTVEVIDVIPIQSINISTVFEDGMAIDERVVIDYSVQPAGASKQLVRWSSNNEAAVKVSSDGILTGAGVGQAVITGTSIDGSNISKTFTVEVMEGKINDTFVDGVTPRWIVPTSGASGVVQNNTFWVTLNTGNNRRGDFRRTNTTLHIGKYPIIAFKFTRPLASAGNIFFDTNQGRWKQTTANGNNQMTILLDKNNEQVFYADMGAFNTFGTTGFTLPTTSSYTFSQIGIGVADMPTAQNPLSPYPVYWIRTFKTVAELQAYINR